MNEDKFVNKKLNNYCTDKFCAECLKKLKNERKQPSIFILAEMEFEDSNIVKNEFCSLSCLHDWTCRIMNPDSFEDE